MRKVKIIDLPCPKCGNIEYNLTTNGNLTSFDFVEIRECTNCGWQYCYGYDELPESWKCYYCKGYHLDDPCPQRVKDRKRFEQLGKEYGFKRTV